MCLILRETMQDGNDIEMRYNNIIWGYPSYKILFYYIIFVTDLSLTCHFIKYTYIFEQKINITYYYYPVHDILYNEYDEYLYLVHWYIINITLATKLHVDCTITACFSFHFFDFHV